MRLFFGLVLALLLPASATAGATSQSIPAGEVEIPVTRYPAAGPRLVLWLPSEYGVLAQDHETARKLAQAGVETWVADLYGARFLPTVPSSAEMLPAEDVYHVIRAALAAKQEVWLLSVGRGAKYTLEGAHLWQEREGRDKPLAGAILLYPNLYAAQPDPGSDPVYLPITGQTRLDVRILQGELSPWYWTLDTLTAELQRGGSQVITRTFAAIRDRFYFREDATPVERELAGRLPALIHGLLLEPPVEYSK